MSLDFQGQSRNAPLRYTGVNGQVFGLSLLVAFLSLLTLGIYRFWGKTKLRQYIWSHAELGGDRFEYTGTGLEKFLGFLIAVVFLAIYLGLFQMALFFFGLRIVAEPETPEQFVSLMVAIYGSLLAVLPFIIFAIYRARRYKLARTRWRGIRFGMEKGAWGYVLRFVGHSLLTLLTLGLLLPRQTFYLEKYMTDRTWLGDARFEQQGRWQALYPGMLHIFLGLGIVLVGVVAAVAMQSEVAGAVAGVVGYIWLMVGFVHYRVRSFGYLTSHKVLADEVTFDARPSTAMVVMTYIVAGLVIAIVTGIAFGILAAIGAFAMADVMDGSAMPELTQIIPLAVLYVLILMVAGAAVTGYIVHPILAHYVTSIEVRNLGAVEAIRQRAADRGADAEGFADALDIGGAI